MVLPQEQVVLVNGTKAKTSNQLSLLFDQTKCEYNNHLPILMRRTLNKKNSDKFYIKKQVKKIGL